MWENDHFRAESVAEGTLTVKTTEKWFRLVDRVNMCMDEASDVKGGSGGFDDAEFVSFSVQD